MFVCLRVWLRDCLLTLVDVVVVGGVGGGGAKVVVGGVGVVGFVGVIVVVVVVGVVGVGGVEHDCFLIKKVGIPNSLDPVWPRKYKHFTKMI